MSPFPSAAEALPNQRARERERERAARRLCTKPPLGKQEAGCAMGLFKKKQANADEKKDLKSNYTTEDHKTDLDVLLSSLNTHATQVGLFAFSGGRSAMAGGMCLLWLKCSRGVGVGRLAKQRQRQSIAYVDVAESRHSRGCARQQSQGLCGRRLARQLSVTQASQLDKTAQSPRVDAVATRLSSRSALQHEHVAAPVRPQQ